MDEDNDQQEPVEVKKPKTNGKRKFKLWGAIALGILIAFIAVQNLHALQIRILFWQPEVPGIILLPFVFLLGVVVGYIVRRKPWSRSKART